MDRSQLDPVSVAYGDQTLSCFSSPQGAAMTTTPQATTLHADLLQMLGERGVLSDERSLATFSKDAFYYSPVLRAELGGQAGRHHRRAAECGRVARAGAVRLRPRPAAHHARFWHRQLRPVRAAGGRHRGLDAPPEPCPGAEHRHGRGSHRTGGTAGADRAAGAAPGVGAALLPQRPGPPLPSGASWGGGFGGVGSIRNGVLWDGFLASITVMEVTPQAALHRLEGAQTCWASSTPTARRASWSSWK